MTLFPPALDQRFAATLRGIQTRLARLEARTAAIDGGYPLAILPGTVDPGYSSGDPKVYVNGSTTLTGPYWHLASYTPAANDLVAIAPIGGSMQSYVVLGKLT